MRMQRTAAVLALGVSAGAAWAQEGTVPVSVEGTLVQVPSDIAAAACGLDDDQLEAAIQAAGEGVTATEVETTATTTGTTEDTSTGTTDDVAAAGETGGGAVPAGDDAPEGTDPELAADDDADDAGEAASGDDDDGAADLASGGDASGDDADDMSEADADDDADDVATADASAGTTPLCEISQAEATAQGIELP